MTTNQSLSRVYGRGFYDGLKAAGIEVMTPSKYRQALEGQTHIAKKVLDFVPIQERWTVQKIISEMIRVGATRLDVRTAEGCLRCLKDSGLVKESERGLYQRVIARESFSMTPEPFALAAPEPGPAEAVVVTAPAVEIVAPVVKIEGKLIVKKEDAATPTGLGAIAAELRERAAELVRAADRLDAAALGIDEQLETALRDAAKFQQFQALFKGV